MIIIAVSGNMYGKANLHFTRGEILWLASGGSTIKMALCTSSYTPDQDAHEYLDDITNECTGQTGYERKTLVLSDPTYDSSDNTTYLDCGDVTWSASDILARYAIVFVDTGIASTSVLIGNINFGTDSHGHDDWESNSGNFVVTINEDGLFKFTAA